MDGPEFKPNDLFLNRYQIRSVLREELGNRYYSAVDSQTRAQVAVLLLDTSRRTLTMERRLRLRQSLDLLKNNPHDTQEEVLDHGEVDRHPYIILRPAQGQSLSGHMETADTLGLTKLLQLVGSICDALGFVHGLGFPHLALIPEAITYIREGAKYIVQLRGAGLTPWHENLEYSELGIRYFYYMSPEHTGIVTNNLEMHSDLYTLGVLVYQLLTGQVPISGESSAQIMYNHVAQEPLPPSHFRPELPTIVDNIVVKLLAKDPADRYQTTRGLAHDLKRLSRALEDGGESPEFPLGEEDRTGRLPTSVRMIGRNQELQILTESVGQAAQGFGGLVTISAPTGMGKTRLVNALRVTVHAHSGLFVTAKNDEGTGQQAFGVALKSLQEALRQIVRLPEKQRTRVLDRIKSSLGDRAGVLEELIPQLPQLLGELPEPVPLEKESERFRLLATLTDLIIALGSRELPLVLFWDDMQWTDTATLTLIEQLSFELKRSSVVLVLAYRSSVDENEAHPLFQALIKASSNIRFQRIRLKPFTIDETRQLVTALLHQEGPELVEMSQTIDDLGEGNPMYMLECIQQLEAEGILKFNAESDTTPWAYDLHKLKDADYYPSTLDLVTSQLTSLPPKVLLTLTVASVLGTRFSLEKLSQLLEDDSLPAIAESLNLAVRKGFLERELIDFRFRHDRIREALYQRLSSEERRYWHGAWAGILEGEIAGEPETLLQELTTHYLKSHDLERAYHYARRAGDAMNRAYVFEEAANLFEIALQLLDSPQLESIADRASDRQSLQESLGDAYRYTGRYQDALELFIKCQSTTTNQLDRLRLLLKQGDVQQAMGTLEAGAESVKRALRELGVWIPESTVGLWIAIAYYGKAAIVTQLFRRLIKPSKVLKPGSSDEIRSKLYRSLILLYYFLDPARFALTTLMMRRHLTCFEECALHAFAHMSTGTLLAGLGNHKRSTHELRKAIEIARRQNSPTMIVKCLGIQCFVNYQANRLDEAVQVGDEAIEAARKWGEPWELCSILSIRNLVTRIAGELRQSMKLSETLYHVACRVKSHQYMGWELSHMGYVTFLMGQSPELSLDTVTRGLDLVKKSKDYYAWSGDSGQFRALLLAQLGQYEDAIEQVEECLQIQREKKYSSPNILSVHAVAVEVYLQYYRANPNRKLLTTARSHCKQARDAGKKYPGLSPSARLVTGLVQHASGNSGGAIASLQKGLEALGKHPHSALMIKTRITLALASILKENNTGAWQAHAKQALESFRAMGAVWYEDEANRLLEEEEGAGKKPESARAGPAALMDSRVNLPTITRGRTLDPAVLHEHIAAAMQMTGARTGYLLAPSPAGDELQVQAGRDTTGEITTSTPARVPYDLARDVMRNGEGLVIQDAMKHEEFCRLKEVRELRLRSLLLVPVKLNPSTPAVLILENHLAPGVFSKWELQALLQIADNPTLPPPD